MRGSQECLRYKFLHLGMGKMMSIAILSEHLSPKEYFVQLNDGAFNVLILNILILEMSQEFVCCPESYT